MNYPVFKKDTSDTDLHYQTNGLMGTYDKNTPFYS